MCSKCPPLALMHAQRRVRQCLTALSINVLINFVLSCQDTCTQFVNVLDPLLVDLLLHYLRLNHAKFQPQMWPSNKDIPLFIRVPVIMNHRVYVCVCLYTYHSNARHKEPYKLYNYHTTQSYKVRLYDTRLKFW